MKKTFIIAVCTLLLLMSTACANKEPVKSELTLATGTVVSIEGKEDSRVPNNKTTYILNYDTTDAAIQYFIYDIELLDHLNKTGIFYGYIENELFAMLSRSKMPPDDYMIVGGTGIEIPEIQEQYYNSDISVNDAIFRMEYEENK